jgi:hypothetical protein
MLFQERGPRLAGREVVTIEKDLEATRAERLHKSLCNRRIIAAIAEKHIEGLDLDHDGSFLLIAEGQLTQVKENRLARRFPETE